MVVSNKKERVLIRDQYLIDFLDVISPEAIIREIYDDVIYIDYKLSLKKLYSFIVLFVFDFRPLQFVNCSCVK